ncbi:hypothetical protein Rleg5DRAFT_1399 [Rhizobium leguminosarum bv. viciae WSM1455]|jgi:ElaB/YqjD/DUF883 family membrane-anchored ribosome-binding protein|nr:hypothetical protein Rleg5DRAFT_1399 [Rhizobium leguminosarum bv. viciae WSM1455]
MPDPKEPPAAQSMEIKRTAQREQVLKGDLDRGLEHTFVASDAVSATHAAVPDGRPDADAANRLRRQPKTDDDFPVVAQAFGSTDRRSEEVIDAGRDGVRSLCRDADRIAETASEVAFGATAEVRSFLQDVEDKIRERPITAVAIAAAFAFVFGATGGRRA